MITFTKTNERGGLLRVWENLFYFLNHPVVTVKQYVFVRERRVNKVGRGKDLVFGNAD